MPARISLSSNLIIRDNYYVRVNYGEYLKMIISTFKVTRTFDITADKACLPAAPPFLLTPFFLPPFSLSLRLYPFKRENYIEIPFAMRFANTLRANEIVNTVYPPSPIINTFSNRSFL